MSVVSLFWIWRIAKTIEVSWRKGGEGDGKGEKEFPLRFRWNNNLCSSIVHRIMQHVVCNDKGVPVQPLVPGDTWLPPGYFPCHAYLLAPAFVGLAYHLGGTCTFFELPLMEEYRKTMCVFFRNRVVTRCCLNNTKIDRSFAFYFSHFLMFAFFLSIF